MTKVVRIAKEIAEAVGYLHHRNIVPITLMGANVFIEGGKAVLNHFQVNYDTGLVSAWRKLNIRTHKRHKEGWLQYLAPEVRFAMKVKSLSR